MSPGFWSLKFEAQIKCKMTINRGGREAVVIVKGYGRNHGLITRNGNWEDAYDDAIQDFLANLDEKLEEAGL
jgi:molybdate-binding protein